MCYRSLGRKQLVTTWQLNNKSNWEQTEKGYSVVRSPEEELKELEGEKTGAGPGAVGKSVEDTDEAFPEGPATSGRAETPRRQGGQGRPWSV